MDLRFLHLLFVVTVVASCIGLTPASADLNINAIKPTATPKSHAAPAKPDHRAKRVVAPPVRKNATPSVTTRPATPAIQSAPVTPAAPAPLVVSLAGDTPYGTIGAALADAPLHGQVIVKAGVYRESVTVVKPVDLIVDPKAVPGSAVIEGQDQPALTLNSPSARIRGLSFRIAARNPVRAPSSVDVLSGAPIFEICDFGQAPEQCLNIQGAGVSPTFRKCTVHDGALHQVFISDGASARFDDSTILSSSQYGIKVARATLTMTNCAVRGVPGIAASPSYGIVAKVGATVNLSACDVGSNMSVGLHINGSTAAVANSRFHDLSRVGVEGYSSDTPTVLTACEINNCSAYGLYANHARMEAANCNVHDCDEAMHLTKGAFFTAKRCVWRNCKSYGAYIDDGAVGYFSDGVAHDFGNEAVYTINTGNAVVSGCDLSKCGRAAVQAYNAGLTIQDCKLRDFSQEAIIYNRSAKGIVTRVTIDRSFYTAVLILENSEVTVDTVAITSSGDNGFEIKEARATIANSSVAQAKHYGIVVRGGGKCTVSQTTLKDNDSGVGSFNKSTLRLDGCTISGNTNWGIDQTGDKVSATQCRVTGNGKGDGGPL
ncbi:MAG TPA: right-handed parallel beta-helix repeat-containing protein [Capsulimonadaceae bacterium]|jgi:hypothetical protein